MIFKKGSLFDTLFPFICLSVSLKMGLFSQELGNNIDKNSSSQMCGVPAKGPFGRFFKFYRRRLIMLIHVYKIHVMCCHSSDHIFGLGRDGQKRISVLKSAQRSTIGNVSNSKSKNGAQRALLPERHTNVHIYMYTVIC